jgi:hypothetical protein
MKAYVLAKFESNADLSQAKHALGAPGVLSLDLVMGPYDSISLIEGEDLNALANLTKKIRACPGIAESITCPIVE